MKEYELKYFTNGWFVGNFEPTIFSTNDFEVSVKFFQAGDREPRHKQILATELTVIISGIVKMNSKEFSAGAIIEFEPGEGCEFLSVTDATLVCVKFPSIPNDKILM